jgi:ubiquinone/menaquinone biosynthesis C-methylase UbiE
MEQQIIWRHVAAGWKKHEAAQRRQGAPLTERMIAGLRPGDRVLDVASGTGEPAIPAARRVGATGSVLGIDFVEEMLETAREKARGQGVANVEFRTASIDTIDLPPRAFDAATIRFGLMFMPDPVGALVRVRHALEPGGLLALTCWAGPERNPWASMPMKVLARHLDVPSPPPGAPGLFAFADPELLRRTIADAGFKDVRLEDVTLTMADFDSGDEYVRYTLDLAGPLARLFATLPDEQQARVAADIAAEAERLGSGGRVTFTGTAWLATARA